MGYQQIPVETGWHIYAPTFKSLTGESFDLKDIYFVQKDGSAFLTSGKKNVCRGAISIQKIKNDGWYDSSYSWYSTLDTVTGKAWSEDGKSILTKAVPLNKGESFAINNTSGDEVKMVVSGEVVEIPTFAVGMNWSLMGNATPKDIDLKDIYFLQADGTPFLTSGKKNVCRGAISIQKIKSNGWYDTSYSWYSTLDTATGKAWSKDGKEVVTESVPLAAGESFAINNTSGAVVLMVLPSPTKK